MNEKLFKQISSRVARCLQCLVESFQFTPYFKCGVCPNIDTKDFSYQVSEWEKSLRKKIKEIIKYLIPHNTPKVIFPDSCLHPENNNPSWGWFERRNNIICIPRRSLYLPFKELADLIAHEANHSVSGEMIHKTRSWYFNYRDLGEKVFAKFSDFADSPNPYARFSKGYETYPSNYTKEYDKYHSKKNQKKK